MIIAVKNGVSILTKNYLDLAFGVEAFENIKIAVAASFEQPFVDTSDGSGGGTAFLGDFYVRHTALPEQSGNVKPIGGFFEFGESEKVAKKTLNFFLVFKQRKGLN